MADSKLEIILSAKDQTSGAFSSLKSNLTSIGSATTSAGSALTSIGATFAKVGLLAGGTLAAGLGLAIKQASSFESAMSKVQAASQASGSEMSQLHDLALSLGSDLQLAGVDATDAASAMEELAKGGVSVADQMGGATKGALLLFSAGADSVAEATGVAVKAMNIFGLSGGDVAHVADLMAAGAGKSATGVGELGQAFNQSAAVAKNAGLSIEELTGTLAFLAQRGLEGSDAGTSLKTALLALQAPTDVASATMKQLGISVRDANGDMLPFAQIADILKEKLGGLSAAQRDAALKQIFGNDAIRVGIALYEGGGAAINDWTNKVNDAGYAAKIGAQRNDNLASSFDQLKANLQTGAIVIGEKFLPVLRKASDAASEFVTSFLKSKDVQDTLQRLADQGAKALDQLLAKVKDPAFQTQMKEWGTAALDTGRALVSLAGDIKDTLGPIVVGAAKWFGDLDENGKKNVIMFGLVAGAALKFHDELKDLLDIGNNVIDMFKRKAAAKAVLAGANETVAKTAGKTAASFAGAGSSAAAAALAIADLAAVTVVSVGGAFAVATGFAALANKMDEGGQRAKDFTTAQTAAAFAQEHGATATNGAIEGFARYLQMTNTVITSQDQLAASWNAYINNASLGGQSTQALTLAMTAQAQAQLAVNRVLGEGLLGQIAYNDGINVQAGASRALAASMTAGLVAQQQAADAQARYALALQDTNGILTPYQEKQAAANLQVAQAGLNLQIAEARTLAAAQAMAIAEQDTGEFGTQVGLLRNSLLNLTMAYDSSNQALAGLNGENSRLGGYLQVLQGEWDKLDEATKKQGNTTAAQKAEYERLAPAIQYLNGVMGENNNGILDNVLRLVGLEGQLKNTGVQYSTAAQAASGQFGAAMKSANAETTAAQLALAAAEGAARAFGGSATTAAGGASTASKAMQDAAASAANAAGKISALGFAIALLPKSFTITAHVDTSAAEAAIQHLSNLIPRSPAKEGPFKNLPTWMALYDQLAPAGEWALATVGKTTSAMASTLKAAVDDGAKAAAEAASAVAKAVGDVLGASKSLAGVNPNGGPSGAQFSWLTATTTALVGAMQDAAANFKAEGLKAASDFADAAGKVGGSIKNTLDGLAALAGFDFAKSSPSGSALAWFTHLATSLVANFAIAAQMFAEGALKDASDFADAASKVGGSVKNALEGLQALAAADWAKSSPTGSAMAWFTHLIASLVQNFATAATGFADGALTAANNFADSASKVGGAVKNALGGLQDLASADWAKSSPTGGTMAWFTLLVASLVQNFATAAAQFDAEILASANRFAETAGKVAGVIGPALAGFKELATIVAPSQTSIDQLIAGIKYLVMRFGEMAATMAAEGVKAMGDFSDATNKALGAAKTGTDLFKSFDKLVIPSAKAIDNLAIGIRYVIGKFREMAGEMQSEGIAQMQTFAGAAGQVLAAAKSGTDLFASMDKLAVPSAAAIDYLLGSMGYVIQQTRAIANGIGTEGLQQAQAFATGTLNVFTIIKTALDQFAKLTDFKDIPTKTLDALFRALEETLSKAGDLVARSDALKEAALEFLANMTAAAAAYQKGNGMAIGGPALSAPAGVGGGGGGGGGEKGPAPITMNMYGDVYDAAGFQDRVVGTIEDATRRGRI